MPDSFVFAGPANPHSLALWRSSNSQLFSPCGTRKPPLFSLVEVLQFPTLSSLRDPQTPTLQHCGGPPITNSLVLAGPANPHSLALWRSSNSQLFSPCGTRKPPLCSIVEVLQLPTR